MPHKQIDTIGKNTGCKLMLSRKKTPAFSTNRPLFQSYHSTVFDIIKQIHLIFPHHLNTA